MKPMNPVIIARRSNGTVLIQTSETKGFLGTVLGLRSEEKDIYSLLTHGEWEELEKPMPVDITRWKFKNE